MSTERGTRAIVAGTMLALVACANEPLELGSGDPKKLSGRGLYSDFAARTIAADALAYRPDYELWSDGASKRRWLVLPPGATIDTSDMAHWRFPVGTKVFKEFSLGGRPLETRLVEKVADTGEFASDYFIGTFVWNAAGTDADLVDGGVKNVNGTDHEVPKQKLCKSCHLGEPSAVLGVSAVQLSASGTLQGLAAAGRLSVDPGRTFVIPGDETQRQALGTLHANCGHCHAATGSQPKLHLRFLPSEADGTIDATEIAQSTINVPVTPDWLDRPPVFQFRVVPGVPEASAILYRMQQRGVGDQMPPLATAKIDERGVAAVRAWIAQLRPTVDAGVAAAEHVDAGVEDAEDSDAAPAAGDAAAPIEDGGPANDVGDDVVKDVGNDVADGLGSDAFSAEGSRAPDGTP